MSSLPKNLPSSSKPPKNPNPPDRQIPTTAETDSAFPPTNDDEALDHASHLTRPELLKRRLRLFKQLDRCYRDFYWAFMEDLRMKYREYYWIFGASPFKKDNNQDPERGEGGGRENLEGSGENGHAMNGNGVCLDLKNNQRCSFVGCKFKAMALTSFCHLHILSDSKQKLYKACTYVIKSAQAGPIVCGKPILRSVVPSLCTSHFQKAQKHVNRALKKAGLNVSSSSRLAPKFHVVVSEYVRHIQAERRAAKRGIKDNIRIKEENGS